VSVRPATKATTSRMTSTGVSSCVAMWCRARSGIRGASPIVPPAIHEVLPAEHRGNTALHPNKFNQGVTPQMRQQDKQLHWWYRAREQGADQKFPDWIYDN
jgi:hypothetical protein